MRLTACVAPARALLALLAGLVAACGDVADCKIGSVGCFGGPSDDGSCRYGLVDTNGTCGLRGQNPPALSCGCNDTQVCTPDRYRCVDYCEPTDDAQTGSESVPDFISCDGTELDFGQLCENDCLLRCRARNSFCEASDDCTSECAGGDVRSACDRLCASDPDATRCIAQYCSDARALSCAQVTCTDGKSADCRGVQCHNDCPGYNFDGICDDGDTRSAASGACDYGADCGDCGARRDLAVGPQPIGSVCTFHSGCAGASTQDLANAQAWCISIGDSGDNARCAPDCSTEGETCPAGSACYQLLGPDRDGDGSEDPIEQDGLMASACFPTQCE